MTTQDLAKLTPREAAALQVLINERELYRKSGHGIAARTLGVAIWLIWQVFGLVHPPEEP